LSLIFGAETIARIKEVNEKKEKIKMALIFIPSLTDELFRSELRINENKMIKSLHIQLKYV
jgi:hypothetical protein